MKFFDEDMESKHGVLKMLFEKMGYTLIIKEVPDENDYNFEEIIEEERKAEEAEEAAPKRIYYIRSKNYTQNVRRGVSIQKNQED